MDARQVDLDDENDRKEHERVYKTVLREHMQNRACNSFDDG